MTDSDSSCRPLRDAALIERIVFAWLLALGDDDTDALDAALDAVRDEAAGCPGCWERLALRAAFAVATERRWRYGEAEALAETGRQLAVLLDAAARQDDDGRHGTYK